MSVFGHAKSIISRDKYTSDELFRKDVIVLGLLSFAFNKFCCTFPEEIVEQYRKELADDGLPRVSTNEIPEGTCVSFMLYV
jgi:hypothetical protein